ncbi:MAG: Pseudouridine synthase [Parcubacteria group bacterium GW2011_GWA1_47_8]|nr:MAG: Pseudouridine synthase [Parcubacteria group bacterium GW2011_GWA1_47_8]KKW07836.1 MAG: Pseudouridine synthase [Parcubacteria group bacterium GW2011_GWA2_49_16]
MKIKTIPKKEKIEKTERPRPVSNGVEPLEFPIRLNRYLAHKGYTTRRGADLLITKGLVTINSKVATLGTKVSKDDVVEVSPRVISEADAKYRYLAYNKPRGISTDSQGGTQSITGGQPALRGLFPLGRLDKDSHGLIILTNDGRLTERLLSPDRAHEKEYLVRVDKPVTDRFIRRLERGITIEGYRTKPATARRTGETVFRIVLTEGKKHQIRRMCAAEGYQVQELTRVRIMNIALGNLKEGAYRDIIGTELLTLKKDIGL